MERISDFVKSQGFELFGFCKFSYDLVKFQTKNKALIPQNAKSIITFLFPYNIDFKGERNVSLYCIGKDYHTIIKDKLDALCQKLSEKFPQNTFCSFCDVSPIDEVRAAYLSGLGVLGKNSLLINQKYGSYCFIGEIVTDLELLGNTLPLGSCISCGKCSDACFSNALKNRGGEVFLLDTSLCLSSLTQNKKELNQNEQDLIKKGGLVWGCDLCQISCPLNSKTQKSPIKEFYHSLQPKITEESLNSSIKDRAYGYKGKNILKRNLCIIEQKSVNTTDK